MSQQGLYLRKAQNGYIHWCPGCKERHRIGFNWTFNNNLDSPSFNPSVKHTGIQTINDEHGNRTGGWVLDEKGNTIPLICHYYLTDGVIHYLNDCTHELRGQDIPPKRISILN